MKIRRYTNEDCATVAKLFYETVHTVNAGDYTAEQLFAWAKDCESQKVRRNDLLKQYTLIAEINGVIAGFGSIDSSGCLDLLFVHKDYQRKGVATALCNELEKNFSTINTHASITAKLFFENRGYVEINPQEVIRSGVKLKNFKMQKYR